MKSFKIDKESPLYNVAKDIAKDLKSLSRKYTKDDFLKEFANSEKDFEEDYPSLYEIYKKIDSYIYYALCDDVDYPLLYSLNIDYEDDNMLSDGYSGDMYFGKTLTYTDEELNDGNLSIEEMLEVQNKIKDILPDSNCKLYFGTLGC